MSAEDMFDEDALDDLDEFDEERDDDLHAEESASSLGDTRRSSDVFFKFDRRLPGIAHVAARAAVLHPLAGYHRDLAEFRNAVTAVLLRWRSRISELLAAGWSMPEARAAFARNCRPAFATAFPATRYCNLRNICPFCYGRHVASLWRRLAAVERQGLQVVTRTVSRRLPAMSVLQLRDVLCAASSRRAMRYADSRAVGAVMALQLWPSYGGRQAAWRVVSRELYLTSHELPAWRGRTSSPEPATELSLQRALSRVMRYPRALLDGDAAAVVALLAARSRLRLVATYGSVRGVSLERRDGDV